MKIGITQFNPTVGDINRNSDLIIHHIQQAESAGCDLVVFPELALTGYPPEDLLFKSGFLRDAQKALKMMAARVTRTAALVGTIDQNSGRLFNAAAWIEKKKIRLVYHKQRLPNYGVFDEIRYFTPGDRPCVVPHNGLRIGLTICEDIWTDAKNLLPLKKLKPDLVINISASPFHTGKIRTRKEVAGQAAQALQAPLAYCNLIGGQDELVFDGGSFVSDQNGQTKVSFPFFKEGLFTFDFEKKKSRLTVESSQQRNPPLSLEEEIYEALILGTRDYVEKNGFKKVAVGLSGGIDSAVVATLAVGALGKERVVGVTMPSRYNQSDTIQDAERLAKNLGIEFLTIPIQEIFETMLRTLSPHFKGQPPNMAEENLQARIRGNILMALSNKFNWLILTTGNKSETSTGYCTLYGDTAGGFAVIKDVLKTTVYKLAHFINKKAGTNLIPETTLTRPPTAELRDNQKDEDSLGPYHELDPLIVGYVEKNLSLDQLSKQNPANSAYVRRILSLIDRNEYKRRQAPPGIKITPRSFGRDHRMPITNRYQPY